MPATSKAQFRFMKAVQSGDVKKKGLSPAKAAEFTAGQSPKALPAKAKPKEGTPQKIPGQMKTTKKKAR